MRTHGSRWASTVVSLVNKSTSAGDESLACVTEAGLDPNTVTTGATMSGGDARVVYGPLGGGGRGGVGGDCGGGGLTGGLGRGTDGGKDGGGD